MTDYRSVIIEGGFICESMLSFVIQERGFTIENGFVIDDTTSPTRKTILSFCINKKDLLPNECREFVALIRDYRNNASHGKNITLETVHHFSGALDCFTLWFRNNYVVNADIDKASKQKICDRFFSLESEMMVKAQFPTGNPSNDELLKQINVQLQILNDRSIRIEQKVEELDVHIQELSHQIGAYQSLISKQIEKALSDEEVDRLLAAYTDECVEKIIDNTRRTTEDRVYEQEKRKMIASMGSDAWQKLEEQSRTFLISAKVMYNHLIMLDDIIDYSGVCVLVTKALEVEMTKRFYAGFLRYLDSRYHGDYLKYHTALLYQGRGPLSPTKFTMGNLAYVLCYYDNRNDSAQQRANNKIKLLEYAKACLFQEHPQAHIESLLRSYAADIEAVRNKYRNPSAHVNAIRKVDAEECMDLVLDVEKILKKMLDSFDY